jgi:hypothetical protein
MPAGTMGKDLLVPTSRVAAIVGYFKAIMRRRQRLGSSIRKGLSQDLPSGQALVGHVPASIIRQRLQVAVA